MATLSQKPLKKHRILNPLEKIVSTFLHDIILTAIEPITNEALTFFIKNNQDIFDIFAEAIPKKYLLRLQHILVQYKNRIKEFLSLEEMMYQFQEHRPDLTVLETPEGQDWLQKQINIIQNELKKYGLL